MTYIWDRDTCYGYLSISELENPPVENGNEKYESPDGEVDEEPCRHPKGLTELHTTCRQGGIKVFQVVPENKWFGIGSSEQNQ